MGFYYGDWVGDGVALDDADGVAEEFVAVFYLGYTQVYDLLSSDSFEMIMTDHNTAVENFHVYYKGEDITLNAILMFVKAFRERFCTRKANISLYDVNSDYLKKLI